MSKSTLTAIQRYDRANLAAAQTILANPRAEGLQLEWARRFMARWARENPGENPGGAPASGDALGRAGAQGALPLERR